MASLNRFTGSPWHVDKWTRDDGEPRRHRSKCRYHSANTNHCSQINSNCFGSAHCQYYKERSASETSSKSQNSNWKPKTKRKNKYAQYNKPKSSQDLSNKKKPLTVGSRIIDSTYGRGTIKSIYNGLAVVAFDGIGDVLVDIKTSEKSGALRKIEKNRGKWS